MVGSLASLLGHVTRLLFVLFRAIPGLAGPVVFCFGFWLAWHPLGYIMAGVILVAIDLRVGDIKLRRRE